MEMPMTKGFSELNENELYDLEGGVSIPVIHDSKGTAGYIVGGTVTGALSGAFTPCPTPLGIVGGAAAGFIGGVVGATVSGCMSWERVPGIVFNPRCV